MKSTIKFLELFASYLTIMFSFGLFPVSILALVVMATTDVITLSPSFTGLADRNIPMDFTAHNELSALVYYLLAVLMVIVIAAAMNMKRPNAKSLN